MKGLDVDETDEDQEAEEEEEKGKEKEKECNALPHILGEPFELFHSTSKIEEAYSLFYGACGLIEANKGDELCAYLWERRMAMLIEGKKSNPLLWWQMHEAQYPILAQLARKYLVIIPSSASVERIFSWAGWVVDKRRSSLSDTVLEKRIFFVANKHLLL